MVLYFEHFHTKIKFNRYYYSWCCLVMNINSAKFSVKYSTTPRLNFSRNVEKSYLANEKINILSNAEISLFLNPNLSNLLQPYQKKTTSFNSNYNFVADASVASDIASIILQNINKNATIVEGNSGLGLITLNLLKSDVSQIHIYDESELRALYTDQLIKKYSNKIQHKPANIFWRNPKAHQLLLDIISDPGSVIIGVVQNYSFFSNLTYKLSRDLICSQINAELYVVVGDSITTNLLNFIKGGGYYVYCLFNLFFQVEIIAEYPCEAFLPISTDNTKMYLLKIKKNPNMFANFDEEDLPHYKALIRTLDSSKFNFIIPTLEKWVPDCGPYLIHKGISMTFQTCDLSASESVILYKLLKQYSGFSSIAEIVKEP